MGGEWCRYRLGDLVDFNPDSIGADYPYELIKYVDISSVGEGAIKEPPKKLSVFEAPSRARRLVRAGDTVLSTVRPNRRSMFFVRETIPDLVVSTGFAVLRPREDLIEPRFLYALVFDERFTAYLVSRQKGAAYPAVLPSDIAEAEIGLPPLLEQRAIARILGTLDDKIELNRRMNETLEAMAQALFKSWFVDFDAVVVNALRAGNPIPEKFAKRAAHYRDNPDALGLPEDILRLFPARFVDSALGPIPEGWEVKEVQDFTKLKGGKQLPKKHIKPHGPVPVFGGAGIMGYTTESNADGFVITVGRVGAYCGQFFRHIGKVWINNNASLVKVFDLALGEWLYLALKNANIDVIKKGAAQPFVANSDIERLPILWPGEMVASEFSLVVSHLRGLQDHQSNESRTLAALRDTLLPKLISGELRVPDVEKILGDVE